MIEGKVLYTIDNLRIGQELDKKVICENRFEKSSEGLIVPITVLESIDKL